VFVSRELKRLFQRNSICSNYLSWFVCLV